MTKDIEGALKDLEADENDDKKKDWVFEHPISENRQFISQLHIQGRPDHIRNIRARLSNLSNILGLSRNALVRECFFLGLEEFELRVVNGKSIELTDLKDDDAIDWEISQQIKKISKKQARYKDLAVLYHDKGLEEFVLFC